MSQPESVFDLLSNLKENKVSTLMDKLSEVYAHAKSEIVEFLEKCDCDNLSEFQSSLYSKLLEFLPQFKSYKLYARRSKSLMVEDIYIIGYCLLNKLEDKRLKNILMEGPPNESLPVSEEEDEHRDKDLLLMCVELKASVERLTTEMQRLRTRVGVLEDELSNEKIHPLQCVVEAQNQVHPLTSDDDSTDTELDTPVTNRTRRQSSTKDPVLVNACIQTSLVSENEEILATRSPNIGFRHTTKDRNRIVKGKGVKQPNSSNKSNETSKSESSSTSYQSPQVGNCRGPLRIKSAVVNTPQHQHTANHLVYVGQVSRETTEDDMRAHVADLGISDESVADVIKLRCKDGKQSSFCISVCSKDAEKNLFSTNNWPEGVRIRTFRPARTKRYNPLPVKQRPPRLRKGNGQSTNTPNVYQNEHSNKTRSRFHTRRSAVEYQKTH